MVILKWVIDEEFCDDDHGHDNVGHYEEVELTDEEVAVAVKEHFRNVYDLKSDFLFEDLTCRFPDIEEAYGEEIAEYYDGKLPVKVIAKEPKTLWHDAKKERPAKSGIYIVYTGAGMVINTTYSKIYDAFNVLDDVEESKKNAIKVDVWTTYEELGLPKRED